MEQSAGFRMYRYLCYLAHLHAHLAEGHFLGLNGHQTGFPYEIMIGEIESKLGYIDNVGSDTQDSGAAKYAYVKEHNLDGLYEWHMDNDMRPDNSPPTYQVTGWVYEWLAG